MRNNSQKGIAPIAVLIIALLVIGGGGYAVKKGVEKRAEKKEKEKKEAVMRAAEEKTKEEAARTIQVKLNEQNGSGVSGEAVIAQIGTSTIKVIVNLTGLPAAKSAAQAGKPSDVAQPAHIHIGSCPNPGAIKYPLTAIDKGAAQSELPMTLDQLLSELPLAVNVHKSAAEAKVYVACGNIEKRDNAMLAPSGVERVEKKGDEMMKGTESMTKKETRVTYNAQGFSPKTVNIKKGETVVFQNKTGKAASVASEVHPTHLLYPEFDQYKTDQRGKDEFRFTFEKVGAWNYHDHLNAANGGTVVVTE